jgi:diphosphomevalonate decarboxylase
MLTVTAIAHPNIAFIKYWGNRDAQLRLPVNGSISMNLDGLLTRTQVTFDAALHQDVFYLNGQEMSGAALERVRFILNLVRAKAGASIPVVVKSENNFPTGAGIASSAAAFAALSLAASHAAGLKLNEAELSCLARRGSGSASRSVPGGYVEWQMGTNNEDSFAFSIASGEHWDLVDCVAVVAAGHKTTGSTEGHATAATSPLQSARVADAPRRLKICRQAILQRDFEALAEVVEEDSNLMHAVMMTSKPALFYWEPASLALIKSIPQWRHEGIAACYTLDAGPNVHVICLLNAATEVEKRLHSTEGVTQVLRAVPGGPAQIAEDD